MTPKWGVIDINARALEVITFLELDITFFSVFHLFFLLYKPTKYFSSVTKLVFSYPLYIDVLFLYGSLRVFLLCGCLVGALVYNTYIQPSINRGFSRAIAKKNFVLCTRRFLKLITSCMSTYSLTSHIPNHELNLSETVRKPFPR